MSNNHIKEVKLMLPNVIDCEGVFARCSNLISINLNLPKAINCKNMFWRCSSLVNVNLNLLLSATQNHAQDLYVPHRYSDQPG